MNKTSNDRIKQDVLNRLNEMFGRMIGHTGRTKNTYIFWRIPQDWVGTRYAFGYTPWRTDYEGKTGFFAFKYRVLKNGTRKLVRAVRFGRRKIARGRSWKWHQKHYHS